MKKLFLAAALAGAIAVAFGSMSRTDKNVKDVKKTEKKCVYRSECLGSRL